MKQTDKEREAKYNDALEKLAMLESELDETSVYLIHARRHNKSITHLFILRKKLIFNLLIFNIKFKICIDNSK